MIFFVTYTEKDWDDIKFGVDNQVDFYAVSFVKDAKVVHELKDYLKSKVSATHYVFFLFGIRSSAYYVYRDVTLS